ncbi:MAG: hypothetical protein ACE5EW_04990 [Thermoplasmata archaeon]
MAEAEGGHKGRRRPVSSAGKRVMLLSAVASIGLGLVLGFVFLPKLFLFEAQPSDPFYTLAGETVRNETTATIETASSPLPFGEFGVRLLNGTLRYEGPLDPSIPVGPVSYTDGNADGILNVGDSFLVQVETGRNYVLLITLLKDPGPGGVGFYQWDT